MKKLATLTVRAAAAALLACSASAQIVWNGSLGPGIFQEANWDLTGSTVTMLEGNVPISDNVVLMGPAPDARIADLPGQGAFIVADGFQVVIDSMRVFGANDDGIGAEWGAVSGIDLDLVRGGILEVFFVVNRTFVNVDGTSAMIFGGGGNPVNGSFVNVTLGSRLEFLQENPNEFRNEHLGKVTVDGAPAVEGMNVRIDALGAEGTSVVVLPSVIGTNYCTAAVNASGVAGRMSAFGSTAINANQLTLQASQLPSLVFGFFLVSKDQGFVMNPGGSAGNLCLSGAIGRYVGPGSIQNSGLGGEISLQLDLSSGFPQPNGFVLPLTGDTWNFQCWFRDTDSGVATSNFTDGLLVMLI